MVSFPNAGSCVSTTAQTATKIIPAATTNTMTPTHQVKN
jgi:hypothetical protein